LVKSPPSFFAKKVILTGEKSFFDAESGNTTKGSI